MVPPTESWYIEQDYGGEEPGCQQKIPLGNTIFTYTWGM